MKADLRLFLCNEDGTRFFGAGPYHLLCGISEIGSLRTAAAKMGLSYSKATNMLHRAEKGLGFALTKRSIGGKGGGGSLLTEEAKTFLKLYTEYMKSCSDFMEGEFNRIFAESGEGK